MLSGSYQASVHFVGESAYLAATSSNRLFRKVYIETNLTLIGVDEDNPSCKVCDHPEREHVKPGRRALSSDAIQALREKIIDISVEVEAAQASTDQAFSDSEPST